MGSSVSVGRSRPRIWTLVPKSRGIPSASLCFVASFSVLSAMGWPLPGEAQDHEAHRALEALSYPVDPSSSPRPVAWATRTDNSITLDGRLDEPAWDTAEPLTNFVQKQPHLGELATEQTIVRILFDDEYLYIAVSCLDTQPDKIVVTSLERDFGGNSPRNFDVVSITLDPFLDRRNAMLLHVNPAGAVRDAQVTGDGRIQNVAWRGVWFAEAMVTDSGWVAEIAIPWTTLRFDPTRDEQVWGLNIQRRVRWKNEESVWSPLERHEPSHRMSRAGTLMGLKDVSGGRHLVVNPDPAWAR